MFLGGKIASYTFKVFQISNQYFISDKKKQYVHNFTNILFMNLFIYENLCISNILPTVCVCARVCVCMDLAIAEGGCKGHLTLSQSWCLIRLVCVCVCVCVSVRAPTAGSMFPLLHLRHPTSRANDFCLSQSPAADLHISISSSKTLQHDWMPSTVI